MSRRRPFLAPEVVQTSAMDCGPASLKALLAGSGVHVSYGRLREACQTDVDGTSIDTLEDIAVQLGVDAEQVMMPLDHLLLEESRALPAIVVTQLPSGLTHFVVVWRVLGPFVQVMDPGTGRRWVPRERFLAEVHEHRMPVPASSWREWAESSDFLYPLRRRLEQVGLAWSRARPLVERCVADSSYLTFATLDAAVRMVDALVRAGGVSRGGESARLALTVFEAQLAHMRESPLPSVSRGPAAGLGSPGSATNDPIPPGFWQVRPFDPDEDGNEQVVLRGCVLVRVPDRSPRSPLVPSATPSMVESRPSRVSAAPPQSPELLAALREPPTRPGRDLLRHALRDGVLAPSLLLVALSTAAACAIVEALLFRGLFDVAQELDLVEQRIAALAVLVAFSVALVLLEIPSATAVARLGRGLETRLRAAFLEKIPRLGDRYFQSRPASDMTERSHALQSLRNVPSFVSQLTSAGMRLLVTAAGIVWIHPSGWWLVVTVTAASVAIPWLFQRTLSELDLRFRTHAGSLGRFVFDALVGLVAVRAHGSERAVRREHEGLLVEWAHTGRALQRRVLWIEGLQSVLGLLLTTGLLLHYVGAETGERREALLLLYWALSLPQIGQELGQAFRQYPAMRSVTLRLMEPLGAPEEQALDTGPAHRRAVERVLDRLRVGRDAVSIEMRNVAIRVSGHSVLSDVSVEIPAGGHVAVVGSSGAGKTSLVGLLLGWHRPAEGQLLVDGHPLEGRRLADLRRHTAWVDPTVQLWNRSLLENLTYGLHPGFTPSMSEVLEQAQLRGILERLPEGLQTSLGEGGGLVSGGEGQRVRLGRALLRPDVRMVVLDEPFRGLDRERRRQLLTAVREHWKQATLFCITHDVGETLSFERVLVIHEGRLVEDGAPHELAADPSSRYRALLDAEREVREALWGGSHWRRLKMVRGKLAIDDGSPTAGEETAA